MSAPLWTTRRVTLPVETATTGPRGLGMDPADRAVGRTTGRMSCSGPGNRRRKGGKSVFREGAGVSRAADGEVHEEVGVAAVAAAEELLRRTVDVPQFQ